jgi:hypothetical protein
MPVDEYIKDGHEKIANGDRMGLIGILYDSTFKKGLGDKFYGRELANEKLGSRDRGPGRGCGKHGQGARGQMVWDEVEHLKLALTV